MMTRYWKILIFSLLTLPPNLGFSQVCSGSAAPNISNGGVTFLPLRTQNVNGGCLQSDGRLATNADPVVIDNPVCGAGIGNLCSEDSDCCDGECLDLDGDPTTTDRRCSIVGDLEAGSGAPCTSTLQCKSGICTDLGSPTLFSCKEIGAITNNAPGTTCNSSSECREGWCDFTADESPFGSIDTDSNGVCYKPPLPLPVPLWEVVASATPYIKPIGNEKVSATGGLHINSSASTPFSKGPSVAPNSSYEARVISVQCRGVNRLSGDVHRCICSPSPIPTWFSRAKCKRALAEMDQRDNDLDSTRLMQTYWNGNRLFMIHNTEGSDNSSGESSCSTTEVTFICNL